VCLAHDHASNKSLLRYGNVAGPNEECPAHEYRHD
jgi:hypothetical protein